jgi:hypothetical protein
MATQKSYTKCLLARVSGIVPSLDGRLLAFTRRMFIHDVMLLENP